ncbi:hypothetical protein BHM03_00000197 [Ensete ventricosum]|nr:hypothetical protein BHM03_00000197 [Ensete ventricosum]
MRPQVKVSALLVSGRSYRPYLCQVGRTTTGVSALPVSGRPYDRWRPHTCVRLACRVGLATSAGQLSEGAMMWWPGHHVPYHSPREDLLGAPDEGVADEVLCLATGARDGDVARADPTEQELGNCDVARVDPTEQELGNYDVARVDPTEQELGNCDVARVDPTEQELGNSDVGRVDPTEQELGNCDVARVDLTEQELGNCDVARVDPTEQELGNCDVARVDPTEQELGNCDVARVDPTEQELGNCDVARVDPTEQELGTVIVDPTEQELGNCDVARVDLTEQLGVGAAAVASSVGRGWSSSVWCSVPESPGRSNDMSPPSSAKNVRGEYGACLVDTFRLRDYGASTAGSGPCALAHPRSSQYGVETRPDK